ncbi:phage tail protein [Providencia rettgeri]|uniref:phage tail-collar fiber domain-containing protein n=1 Tax=Providencia rettgeri TaxID=587 RepID=UPI00118729CE|nr:phage tail protein [Providencia rettgeri]
MKYFALLTKLGENLLAQATALGTKLELTHMAVGDGGGSLPTPDTNQTKLIAEKRRAAINTLFIDDKNKNQIIAEQIIPEQDGGWWIREIGLFDKAGNLIAVANCPETYKPQLAEGSGRTQSIRIVLIVSHTESVTLKIDPSVVLATREYVNTEITVIDKKIDALSAQTKLDLNKKFDKANISGQKGNDNDKVPSLNLFTTEIGKLAALGYSYSKIESDGRYQPKGNYAPAGDYATNTALNNGLDSKLPITKPEASELLVIKSAGNYASLSLRKKAGNNGERVDIETLPDSYEASLSIIYRDKEGKNVSVTTVPKKTGTMMLVGEYGLGSSDLPQYAANGLSVINKVGFYGVSGNDPNRVPGGGGGNFVQIGAGNYFWQLGKSNIGNTIYFRSILAGVMGNWLQMWSETNTTTDRNGHLKVSGISDDLSDYPVGAPIPWPQATAPAGFLVCNGQSFNKTTYPLLAKAYPTGVLPDLRGEFLRGLDAGRGVDSGRAVLSAQGDAFRAHNHSVIGEDSGSGTAYFGRGNGSRRSIEKNAMNLEGGTETRPRNIAFLYIVRAA